MEIGITYEKSMISYRRYMSTDGRKLTRIPHAYLAVYIIVLIYFPTRVKMPNLYLTYLIPHIIS